MGQPGPEDKAKEVKTVVERIHAGLLRAHRTIYRAAVRRQNDIGSGHPSARDERETALGKRLFTDSSRDLVVIGFWYEGLRSPKYVCSSSGMNIVRAVRKVANRSRELANSWRSKDRAGIYHTFLREARRIEPDVQEIERETRKLTNRHELDMLRLERTLGVAFRVTEAEARLASYLMRHDVRATVHFYATDSPCCHCSRTFAALGPAQEKLRQRVRGVLTTNPGLPGSVDKLPMPILPGLDWRIGWIYYGQVYATDNPTGTTDLKALDAAVKAGSIQGHAQF